MIDTIQMISSGLCTLLAGVAAGAAWIAVISSPNVSYDRLDASRADGHVRTLLFNASTPLAGLLLAAGAFGVLAGHLGAAIAALVAALGFFSNRWTLAPKKRGEAPPGVRQSKKAQRIVAVSLSLMFAGLTLVAGVLSIAGI